MEARFALLGILDAGPNYGYGIKKIYDQLFGSNRKLAAGQIYSTLGRLHRDGSVTTHSSAETSGGPERIKYAITPTGRNDFLTWLESPEPPVPYLQATLYIKTVLALSRTGEAAPYLQTQHRAHIARMRELTNQRRDADLAQQLLIDHAIYHLEADLRWIEITTTRLTKLKEELCLPKQ